MKPIIQQKQKEVDAIVGEIDRAKSFVLFEYHGLDAATITALRKSLNGGGCKMYVLKNNILSRAFKTKSISDFENLLSGPNAVAFGFEDEISVFKSINEVVKKHDFIKIKGAYFNGSFVDVNQFKTIASIPNREGLYSMLLSCLTSPIRGVAYALKAVANTKQA